ncbi:MATE family efflux transporter [Lacticaseibacillus thailandensis]|uniref:Multidrug export protein MepA n=1 Tax=Lacticaseibacillus thailandensis DSM 22698 = JCM 13996 TaxID=1423810 RepID=A0A0R2C5W4_9LACO|nr:MATE family efflux transporter [Lacticaseibacillus thailandensis]KRM87153.1 Na+ driven multidrug efflux pump [Lacticaseibacillus thailandensis DSM 22698 = JCM 13996]
MDELFEKAPVPKVYMQLALPVVVGMVASMVYNLADTFFIAKTGNADLVAGVALGAPLFSFMLALGDIFGLGGSALLSRLMGKHSYAEVRRVSSFCFYAAIGLSLVVTALMLGFERPILTLLGATAATRPYAGAFYQMLVGGAAFIIVSLVPGNIIRTEGMARQSMIATMAGTIFTIILDPIFLFVLHWGAGGVGLANVIGYVLNTGLLVWFMATKSHYLSLSVRAAHIDRTALWEVIAIGIPASLTNFMQSFGTMLLNQHLAPYGANAVAAMGIAQKVYMIVMLIMVGFAFGAQPLVGYNYGAHNRERLRAILHYDFKVEVVYAVVCAVVLMLAARPVLRLFMNQPAIVTMGSQMLRALLLTTPFVGAILVFTTVFQSTGQSLGALVMSISRQGVIFAVVMLVLPRLMGFNGVIWAQAAADVLTFLVGLVLYRRSKILA